MRRFHPLHKDLLILLLLAAVLFLLMGCDSHGTLASYKYNIRQPTLDKAVKKVIAEHPPHHPR